MPRSTLLATLLFLGCHETSPPPKWSTVFANLDRSVLAAWGSSDKNIYLVGGGLGVGPALVLYRTGDSWRELDTGRPETLWWVWGASEGMDVWMVGEQGLILRWNGTAFQAIPSGTKATLFGVWGAAEDDVWIVGGLPGHGPDVDNDVVLHWDGRTLARDTSFPLRGAALFKVWGAAAQDVWVVGEAASLWRRDPRGWQSYSIPELGPISLLTVHGCSATEVYATGGQSLLLWNGVAWAPLPTSLLAPAQGVSCGADGVLVVGLGGLKLRYARATETWHDEQFESPWNSDFHGAWMSPDGSAWAVGGNYAEPASAGVRVGVVAYYGASPPALGREPRVVR